MLQSVFERSMMVLRAWQDVSAVQHWKRQVFIAWLRACDLIPPPLVDDVSSSEVVVEPWYVMTVHRHFGIADYVIADYMQMEPLRADGADYVRWSRLREPAVEVRQLLIAADSEYAAAYAAAEEVD